MSDEYSVDALIGADIATWRNAHAVAFLSPTVAARLAAVKNAYAEIAAEGEDAIESETAESDTADAADSNAGSMDDLIRSRVRSKSARPSMPRSGSAPWTGGQHRPGKSGRLPNVARRRR